MRSNPLRMRNPFLTTAGPRFADREELLSLARETAERIATAQPYVREGILFGSFARGDYGTRSDLDLLVILDRSDKPARERLVDFLEYTSNYPMDIFPLTQAEIESRLREGDPFLRRVMREGILLYPAPESAQ